MSEIKDYNKLQEELQHFRIITLKLLDIFVEDENTKKLRKNIVECDDAVKLVEYSTLIVNALNRNIWLYG